MTPKEVVTSLAIIVLFAIGNPTVTGSITLEDILNSKYVAARFSGRWISDNQIEYKVGSNIHVRDVSANTTIVALDTSRTLFQPIAGKSFSFSPDRAFVLITSNVKKQWRYSNIAHYDIHDVDTPTIEPISIGTERDINLFVWANTNAAQPNAFAFVHKNNIYYCESALTPRTFKQITFDGIDDGTAVVSNGLADWVYEEEMLGTSNALWFSPNAENLAYIQFNDTEVENFQFPMYGGAQVDLNSSYPKWTSLRYPKAGSTNPTVKLKAVDLSPEDPIPIDFTYFQTPTLILENLYYIATVKWLTEETLLVIHLNRDQNVASYFVCDITSTRCEYRLQETVINGWLDVYTPRVSEDGAFLITIMPRTVGEVKYKQVVKVNVATGQITQVTQERFSVASILGWNENTDTVYFSATGFTNDVPRPSSTHIYSIQTTGQTTAHDMTLNLVNFDKERCEVNSASFSQGFSYWIHTCSGPGIPESHVRQNRDPYPSYSFVERNDNLRQLLTGIRLPRILDYSIPLDDPKFSIKVRLLVPPDFNERRKYPLFIDVYGGPGSQSIRDTFDIDWGTSLVLDKKIIYGRIDGRGSGGQTQDLLHLIYKRLGTYEVQDQIDAVKWLIDNTKFVNADHTGIWGWSYGGYASSMALATDDRNVFKCAISVAPVTSWRYYDTIYTERFMSQPENNLAAYNEGQVTTRQRGFRNKEFLLVHGNADDNVHYQQAMILARELEKADIIFDQLSYPDEDHSISGTQRHLYHSFEHFLFRSCLRREVAPPPVTPCPEDSSSSRLSIWTGLTVMPLLAIWCHLALF